MALLIHPDKHDSKKEFVDGFQKLGSLYDEFGKSTARDLKEARAMDWRLPAEYKLLCLLCQQQGLPQPKSSPSPPPPPARSAPQSAPQQGDGQAAPAFNLLEHINVSTARVAQNLLAFRNLRIAGDASKSWATATQEQLDKVKGDAAAWNGMLVGSFKTTWHETDRSGEMGYEGRLQSGKYCPEERSTFGLPRILQELFRIGLKCCNLDGTSSHYVSIVELIKIMGLNPDDFPDVIAVAFDREKYADAIKDHAFMAGMTADDIKVLLISIAYQCMTNAGWPQCLKDLHMQIEHLVNMHARLYPAEVAVAKSWGKVRPKVTAFSYKLCHLERVDVNRQLAVVLPSCMCYEYDGLVLFTDLDGTGLADAAAAARAASQRPLKIKPYAQSFQDWLRAAALRYPAEDWTLKSKFPWKDVRMAQAGVKQFLSLGLEVTQDGPKGKVKMPETDFAKLVSVELECSTIVVLQKAYHFDGIKWQTIGSVHGMHALVKKTAARLFRSKEAKAWVKHGKLHFDQQGLAYSFAKLHDFLTTTRLEVASDLDTVYLPEFDAKRELLSGNNGKTVNCTTGQCIETHYSMYSTKCVPWPIEEWNHPKRGEYRALVKDIIEHWKTSKKPDLQIVRAEPDEDGETEPAILHYGKPDLLQRVKSVFGGIEYLRLRLQAGRNDVDLCIYKEQWICRLIASVPHLCELLYSYGPPGSGKDVDALFVQEFFGADFCGSIPTSDVIKLPNQQERGVEGSTPSMAALQGKRAALIPEVPEGEFAWHRLKHFVEQQGIKVNTRANGLAPSSDRPSFGILAWSNYAPNMGGVEGAARRTAVINLDARYGARASQEDGLYVDDAGLKYRIIQGDYRQDQLWTAIAWLPALMAYSTSIPKPHHVQIQSSFAVADTLKGWAEEHLEAVAISTQASTCTIVKKAVAAHLGMGVRDPQLAVRMRSAGFSLDVLVSGGKKRACKYMFAEAELPQFVQLKP